MEQHIRVLRLIARMNVGGPALQVVGLHEGLDPERFEQRLLTGAVETGEADYLQLRAPHVEPVRVPGLGRSIKTLGDARALAAIVSEIRRFRPHIVHTHTAKAGVLGRLGAVMARVPRRVHTFHGHLLHSYFSPSLTRGVVAVERGLAKRTDRLVAVGANVRNDLLEAGIGRPEQYLIVPPGVHLPPPPEPRAARVTLGLEPDRPVVAFVARLTSVKRPDRMVEVARAVTADRPDAVFIVVGEGAELEATRARAADLSDRVQFLGWRSDVETVYAAATVTLLTSDNEGMPVSLIESSLAGCPAVAPDVGSTREVVVGGVTGLVTRTDAGDLADGILRILNDPAMRARYSEAAQEHARRKFGRERLVDDTARLYQELIEERRMPCASS